MSLSLTINEFMLSTGDFIRQHQHFAAPICFLLAFAESLAFLSLLVPATVLLLGIGVLLGELNIAFIPVWLAASAGAFFGDWVSYAVGYYFKDRVAMLWPINKNPQLLERGHRFFERWGMIGVFVGRFFGPLRAIVPLIAGVCAMPGIYFQIMNLASALTWGFLMLMPGTFGLPWLLKWFE